VSEAWVTNASPIILFARIGRLDLLDRLAPQIIVPSAVLDEVRVGQEKAATATLALDWAGSRRVPDLAVPASVEHWGLGSGESQAITHGLIGSRWVVLDDRAGRRCRSSRPPPSPIGHRSDSESGRG
jgi:predicted nucleic acid-binding protein